MIKSERPVILTSNEVTLTEGQTAIADMARLQPVYDAPIWVDRINFQVRGISQNTSYFVNMGGDIGCRLQVGRFYLSSDFIPVWSYCEQMTQTNPSNVVGGGSAASPNNTSHKTWTWKLPKPLFVPRGAPIVPIWNRFVPTGAQVGGTAAAQISVIGRVAGDNTVPAEVDIPWVAQWTGDLKTVNTGTAASAVRSNQNDLFNATDKTVHVQRLIGRIRYIRHLTVRVWEEEFGNASRVLNARIFNWDGESLTPDFYRWTTIFEPARCSWNINYDVPPTKSLYIETQPFTSVFASGLLTAYVGMVGYRKEVL